MSMPTVTRVLGCFADWSAVPPEVLEAAALRGTKVHGAISATLAGLFVPDLPEELDGYVLSFLEWSRVIEEVVLVESELVDEHFGFMGHPDAIVRIKGDKDLTVVDWKTPAAKGPLWRAQLAAYAVLAKQNGFKVRRAISVRLKKDGSRAIVDEYTDTARDFEAFLNALSAYRWFKAA